MNDDLPLDLTRLKKAYAEGSWTPARLVEALLPRLAASDADAVWITRLPDAALLARARALEALPVTRRGPLWGMPFAVKDNIDVAGLPTTAACPAFAATPERDAFVVERLLAAGALLIGKTNLDQFATGLVGVRSPYGIARNPFDADFIPGGSSSGSAVAVSAGLVSFALGTDTAGSGRVPAAFTNIVGLKPTKGLISTTGLVPACRSLDCISIFALTAADAAAVLAVAGGFDAADPFARDAPQRAGRPFAGLRLGVPQPGQRFFDGDLEAQRLYEAALERAQALGAVVATFDLAPFLETAQLLYAGPWVAERAAAVGDFMARHPEAVWPTTRSIIGVAERFSATDAFRASYRLAELARTVAPLWERIDAMLLPTAPTIYTKTELEEEPVLRNSRLGTYTNFVNLLDLCGIAVPAGFRGDGLPLGVTFLAPAWSDWMLAGLAQTWQRDLDLKLGVSGSRLAAEEPTLATPGERIELAVVGAHLSGEPLNHELVEEDARLVQATRTAASYRLYALPSGKPGLVRVADGEGASLEVEIWSLPICGLGRLMRRVAAPLAIGTVELADTSLVKGFLCEAHAAGGAQDITAFGGWRAFRRGGARA